MFVQVIKGRTEDAVGLRRQLDRWRDEVRPGAIGFSQTCAPAYGKCSASTTNEGRFALNVPSPAISRIAIVPPLPLPKPWRT